MLLLPSPMRWLGAIALLFSLSAEAAPRIPNPDNQGTIELEAPSDFSRVAVISDVRGNFDNLVRLFYSNNLINRAAQWTGDQALVIVLGNLIGNGPNSVSCLDLIMNMAVQAQQTQGKVLVFLGENETRLLAEPEAFPGTGLKTELARKGLSLTALTDIHSPRGAFLRSLPVAGKIGKWYFSHSGHYGTFNWPQFKATAQRLMETGDYANPFLLGTPSVMNAGQWWKDPNLVGQLYRALVPNDFFGAVFGHDNAAFDAPSDVAVSKDMRLVKVDSGMSVEEGGNPGRILVFVNPQQMEVASPSKLVSIAPGGVIKPLN